MRRIMAVAALAAALAGCQAELKLGRMEPQPLVKGKIAMEEVAQSPRQWTGVAVSHAGRIFVNYPRWSDDVPLSVAELRRPGGDGFALQRPPLQPVPFPDESWQQWRPGADPARTLVCVQSVVVDDQDYLWIVDAGAPKMQEILPGAPKLIRVDLRNNQVVRIYPFNQPEVVARSYLNDVRVDTRRQVAYLTDSGTGAILIVNLDSGRVRRTLGNHPSVKSEHVIPVIDDKPWRRPDGTTPEVHSDGIALSPDGRWLYYHALTGRTLYRVDTAFLLDEKVDENTLARHIEQLGYTGNCDGMEFDRDGRVFLTQIERDAVARFVPEGSGNRVEVLAQGRELQWPDSFAIGPDGALYFTCSQINLQPNPPGPYRLFRLTAIRR